MADPTADQQEKHTKALEENTAALQGSGAYGKNWKETAAAAGETALALGFLTKAAFGHSDTLTKLTTGSYKLSDGLKDFSGMMSIILSPLGKFGTGVKALAENSIGAALAVNESLNKVAGNGVYFANNLGDYSLSVNSARMSMATFEEMVNKSAASFSGFGSTMDAGAKRYLAAMDQFQQTDIVKNLEKTGIAAEELNKLALTYASRSNLLNSKNEDEQREAAAGMAKFVQAADDLARVTGISRKEQEKNLDLEKHKASVLAYGLTATKQQNDLMNVTNQRTTKYGEGIQQLAQEIVMFGQPISKLGSQAAGKLEGAGGAELQESIKAQAAGNEELAKQLFQQFEVKYAQFAGSKEGQGLITQNDEWAAFFQPGLDARAYSTKSIMDEAASRNVSVEQVRKEREAKINQDRELGTKESQLAAVINTANRTTADASIVVAEGFKNLNVKVGESIQNLDLFNSALLKIRPTAELKGVADKYTPEPPEPTPAKNKFATGTMGTLGSLFGDFGTGTDAVLHGKEAVIPENQMSTLFSSALKEAGRTIPNVTAKPDTSGFFDSMTDMFYDVGNMAGKMFNDVGKKSVDTIQKSHTDTYKQPKLDEKEADLKSRIADLNKKGYDATNPYVQQLQNNLNALHTANTAAQAAELKAKKENTTAQEADLKSRIADLNKKGYDATNPYVQRLQASLNDLHKPASSAAAIESKRKEMEAEKEKALKDTVAAQEKKNQESAKQKPETVEPKTEKVEKKEATISDLKDLLVDLNKNVIVMISHIDMVAQHTEKTNHAIKRTSSNRL
jgi:hypothetical protein